MSPVLLLWNQHYLPLGIVIEIVIVLVIVVARAITIVIAIVLIATITGRNYYSYYFYNSMWFSGPKGADVSKCVMPTHVQRGG